MLLSLLPGFYITPGAEAGKVLSGPSKRSRSCGWRLCQTHRQKDLERNLIDRYVQSCLMPVLEVFPAKSSPSHR